MSEEKGEITAKEMGRRGMATTSQRYSKEERHKWVTKGGQATKAKYGREYYQELNRKSHAAKMAKKQKETSV